MYRRREHFIAASELPRDGAAAEWTATVDGNPIERRSDEERTYVAVSDLDGAELSGFVKAFRQKVAAARGEGESVFTRNSSKPRPEGVTFCAIE